MADLGVGTTIAGKYRIESVIAQGLTTTTYGCSSVGGRFFVKVLKSMLADDREDRGRFEREYAVLRKLRHPCIAQVVIMEDAGGTPCIVMEYLEGETLKQLIARGPLDVRSAVGILLQLLGALLAAHAQGVVHRELEPGNLFVVKRDDGSWQLKIFNFGAAQTSTAAFGTGELTQAGTIIGNPEYMAPEQARGKADARSDVYAVGCLAYALLTGAPPFPGTGATVLVRQAGEPPAALRTKRADIPPALDHWVMRALEKRPEDRFRDTNAARDELYAAGQKQAAPTSVAPGTPGVVRATMPPVASARIVASASATRSSPPRPPGATPPPVAGGGRAYAQNELEWRTPIVGVPKGARMAVLLGDPALDGPFTIRLMLGGGFRLAPHSHGHDEHVTVIAGAIKVGQGRVHDPERSRRLGSGSFYFNPAGVPHFAWSDEDVLIQVTGTGPWDFLKA